MARYVESRERVYSVVTSNGTELTGKANRRARRIKASQLGFRVTDAEYKTLEEARKK